MLQTLPSLCAVLCSAMFDSLQLHSPADSSFLEFSKQEYWSGLPFPTPEDLPDPGIELASTVSPAFQVDSLPTEPLGKPSLLLHKTSHDRPPVKCASPTSGRMLLLFPIPKPTLNYQITNISYHVCGLSCSLTSVPLLRPHRL